MVLRPPCPATPWFRGNPRLAKQIPFGGHKWSATSTRNCQQDACVLYAAVSINANTESEALGGIRFRETGVCSKKSGHGRNGMKRENYPQLSINSRAALLPPSPLLLSLKCVPQSIRDMPSSLVLQRKTLGTYLFGGFQPRRDSF